MRQKKFIVGLHPASVGQTEKLLENQENKKWHEEEGEISNEKRVRGEKEPHNEGERVIEIWMLTATAE